MNKKLEKILWKLKLDFAVWRVENLAARYLKTQSMRNWDQMLKAAHKLSEIREQASAIGVH